VNRSENFSVENPVVGEYLAVTNPSTGATNRVKILNVTPSTVTVDANFELAGQNLTFTIKLAAVNKTALEKT
jgi:FKBP-type peptidyl-prolyl cis-trans isomerase 2